MACRSDIDPISISGDQPSSSSSTMAAASFVRSFKSPSLLSPRLRPGMPGRSLSGSSDKSRPSSSSTTTTDNHHNNTTISDDFADLLASGPSTPTRTSGDSSGDAKGQDNDTAPHTPRDATNTDDHDTVPFRASRRNSSRPIAIELPHVKKINTAPAEQPLSARGDLPGGYFPFHEDPKGRVHRPHPFHQEPILGRHQSVRPTVQVSEAEPFSPTSYPTSTMARSDTPVASYLPSGYHNSPLPMGKYYPSNYEQRSNRNQSSKRPSVSASGSATSSIKSDPQVPTQSNQCHSASSSETEVRRRLLQYKRDMVAQAALAASEIVGSSPHGRAPSRGGRRFDDYATIDARFNTPSHRPRSPRLLPLGSPGPVTPMELEATPAGGYLDKGRGDPRRARDGLIPPGVGYTASTS